MRDQEIEHLRTIERLIPIHHTRPTLLLPLWHLAGYTLGLTTALLGTRAAMACTVAVEEVITEHYNDQLRELASDVFREGGRVEEEVMELRRVIRKHRDEEEEHREVGLENEAELTPAYALLTSVIKAGCQAAINVAKVV
jgi:ubiquinone biosynthesis monooxygenase Coq7